MGYSCKTINPRDPSGERIDAFFPGDLIVRYWKSEPVKYANFVAAKEVLEYPLRIFSGVRLLNQGGWCYIGRPVEWCVKERVMASFPEHLLFAVYLNPAMYVYEFRAEIADPDDPLHPRGWRERYGELIWKRNTS